jgi:hypothetical protein
MPGCGGAANRDPPDTGEIVTRFQIAQPEASFDHPITPQNCCSNATPGNNMARKPWNA